MTNTIETSTCPNWCNAHWGSDPKNALDDMHRWMGEIDLSASHRGDAMVYITQGLCPKDELTLSWNGEEHETGAVGARAFAAALVAAADKLDEINAGVK